MRKPSATPVRGRSFRSNLEILEDRRVLSGTGLLHAGPLLGGIVESATAVLASVTPAAEAQAATTPGEVLHAAKVNVDHAGPLLGGVLESVTPVLASVAPATAAQAVPTAGDLLPAAKVNADVGNAIHLDLAPGTQAVVTANADVAGAGVQLALPNSGAPLVAGNQGTPPAPGSVSPDRAMFPALHGSRETSAETFALAGNPPIPAPRQALDPAPASSGGPADPGNAAVAAVFAPEPGPQSAVSHGSIAAAVDSPTLSVPQTVRADAHLAAEEQEEIGEEDLFPETSGLVAETVPCNANGVERALQQFMELLGALPEELGGLARFESLPWILMGLATVGATHALVRSRGKRSRGRAGTQRPDEINWTWLRGLPAGEQGA